MNILGLFLEAFLGHGYFGVFKEGYKLVGDEHLGVSQAIFMLECFCKTLPSMPHFRWTCTFTTTVSWTW